MSPASGGPPRGPYPTQAARAARTATDRQAFIRDQVHQSGSVTVDNLVATLGVSRMTVHRDLDALELVGVLRKVRGGATAARSSLFESDLPYRLTAAVEAKAAIGRAAAELLERGQAVLCDESTTTMAALRAYDPIETITVITNCLATMQFVTDSTQHRLISLGGDYVPRYQAFLGILCEKAIGNLYADVLLASCSAVIDRHTFHQDQQIVAVKRAMIAAAPMRVLLLDSSKIGTGAVYSLGQVADFTHLVTDSGAPEDFLAAAREDGLTVVVAAAQAPLASQDTTPA